MRSLVFSCVFFILGCFTPQFAEEDPLITEKIIHTFSEDYAKPFTFKGRNGHFFYERGAKPKFGMSHKTILIMDGKEVIELNNIGMGLISQNTRALKFFLFSSDGEHYCYYVNNNSELGNDPDKKILVHDGKKYLGLDIVGSTFRFSSDGNQFCYMNKAREVYHNEKVVLDLSESIRTASDLLSFQAYFYPDTQKIGLDLNLMIFNPFGKEYQMLFIENKEVEGRSLTLSNDRKSYAYIDLSEKKKETVVLNGEAQGTFAEVSQLEMHPDGSRVAYAVKNNYRYRVYENKKELASFKKLVSRPTYSGYGDNMAYFGADDPKSINLFIDGKAVSTYALKGSTDGFMQTPILGATATCWGYSHPDGFVAIENLNGIMRPVNSGDRKSIESLQFNSDDSIIAGILSDEHNRLVDRSNVTKQVFFNWKRSREYRDIDDLRIGENEVTFMAMDEKNIYQVTWRMKPASNTSGN